MAQISFRCTSIIHFAGYNTATLAVTSKNFAMFKLALFSDFCSRSIRQYVCIYPDMQLTLVPLACKLDEEKWVLLGLTSQPFQMNYKVRSSTLSIRTGYPKNPFSPLSVNDIFV